MNARELITHPITAGAAVLSALGSLGTIPFDLWGLISSTAGLWFPAVATTAATILPEIGYEAIGTKILIGAAIVFVAVQLDRLYDRAKEWYNDR